MDIPLVYYSLLAVYGMILVVVAVYGLHRYQLVYLYYKHRRNAPELKACFRELPHVCIQLPMYNERLVARRIIEACCRIDYPRDRLGIQVLDDSTDDSAEIARTVVEEMLQAGHAIEYIHRTDRTGFKAGALAAGLERTDAEFVCIFDADFVPPPDILQRTIHHFTDERVGMVQARWDHINRDHSLLTKTQAILLDGHFVIEHAARNRSGRFMSFNGTAGLWRKTCIAQAGGWQHDTLTEDLDLSYRAQMRGWQFVFLPNLISPAELPPDMAGFKAQQHRWAKGGAQTARKLLPGILRSRLPFKIKTEAFFHLTSCVVYLFIVLMTLLLFPALYLKLQMFSDSPVARWLFDFSLLLVATFSASTFYACSQREVFRTWSDSVKYLPFLMSLGIGMSLNNTRAALEGFFGQPGEFVRTPKFGVQTSADASWKHRKPEARPRKKTSWQPYLELAMGVYLCGCLVYCLAHRQIGIGIPFLALFAVGYLYVSLLTLTAQWQRADARQTVTDDA
jgi:cellulose synthase/poly-beta-1,6-N-acetylglucosamine synthase-like glycosyltransferase